MALDQECHHPEEKKSLREEDKKEKKKSPPKTCYVLKKRAEFLDIRKNGKTIYAQFFIINYFLSSQSGFYFGLTVSRKIGNAVKRNYLKRDTKFDFTDPDNFKYEKTDVFDFSEDEKTLSERYTTPFERVLVEALDFDWIFKDNYCETMLRMLS